MAAHRPASTRSAPEPIEPLRVARLGADGDGVALLPDGAPLFVAGALPGELVRVRRLLTPRGEGWAADLDAILERSPARAVPPCRLFGACGGCVAQHLDDPSYTDWKIAQVQRALRRAGFADIPMAPLARTPPGGRRRMDLALRRTGAAVTVGLHRSRSRDLADIDVCAVLDPALVSLIAPLRRLLATIGGLRREGSAIVNLLDTGADVLLRTDAAPGIADRLALTQFARREGVARVSWGGRDGEPEPICVLRPATLQLSGVTVAPPAGAFLQASRTGEAAIIESVLAGLPDPMPAGARVAELYAGVGTLTFALARRARVSAFEGDPASLAALARASREAGLAGRVAPFRRDLSRQPLGAAELSRFAAVVLDPPYAGAAAQMGAIAQAGTPRVIYVSCSPAALGRDARPLASAGYRVTRVTPVDQFLWSARIESVIVFTRTASKSSSSSHLGK